MPGSLVFRKTDMKAEHTIIEEWPYRLKLEPGEPGAGEAFNRALSRDSCGKECYVEWRRIVSDDWMEMERDSTVGGAGDRWAASPDLLAPAWAVIRHRFMNIWMAPAGRCGL